LTPDAADRLMAISDAKGNNSPFLNLSYQRDSVNDLTGDGSNTYAYDTLNRATNYNSQTANYAYNAADEITKTPANSSFTYDAAGELTAMGGTTYTYDQRGNRTQIKSHGQTNLTYDQANRMPAYGSPGSYPYGNVTSSTGTLTNPFRFAGQYLDTESGLYYLRARYYDPATAQFISRDPLVMAAREPYAYSTDNPLNSTDISGLLSASDVANVNNWLAGFFSTVTGGLSDQIFDPCSFDPSSSEYSSGQKWGWGGVIALQFIPGVDAEEDTLLAAREAEALDYATQANKL